MQRESFLVFKKNHPCLQQKNSQSNYRKKPKNYRRFKIGKSEKSKNEVYLANYSKTYEGISELAWSSQSKKIDWLEKYLLDKFKNYPNCENGNFQSQDLLVSERYIIYVVFSY